MEKVTSQALRDMHIGQTRIFSLDSNRGIQVARVLCNKLKNEEEKVYRVNADYASRSVSITRIS